MRSIVDSAFDDTQFVDVLHGFGPMWLELDAREMSQGADEADRDSALLECSGELLDASAVKLAGEHESGCGFKTLRFTCPRCNEPHESARLR
jgi:hypothetical protein